MAKFVHSSFSAIFKRNKPSWLEDEVSEHLNRGILWLDKEHYVARRALLWHLDLMFETHNGSKWHRSACHRAVVGAL